MSEPENTPEPNQPQQRKISIDIPRDLKAAYANVAFISHTPVEMVLDFGQVLPRSPRGSLVARVIMTPAHAKMLQMALAQNVANYERQYGQIRLPAQQPSIADDFFRFPPDESGDGDNSSEGDK
jgi:hypothetical protein